MTNNNSILYLVILAILANVVFLLPVLDSPYLGDDSWCESTIRGTAQLSGKSLGAICANTVVDYVRSGRWYPGIIYYYPIFYYLDRHAYKIVAIAFVVFNVILFGYFVNLLAGSARAGLLSMLLAPLSFQFRLYHDPIMSYYYLMQVEFSLILLSLILLVWYVRSWKRALLWLSVGAYALCLLVYEAFYGVWVVHGLIALLLLRKESPTRACKITAPFLVATLVNAGLTVLVRSLFAAQYEGITLNFSPITWIIAFSKQAFAAIPMSYVLTSGAIENGTLYAREYFGSELFVACGLWLVTWLMAWELRTHDSGKTAHQGVVPVAAVGLALWLLPGTLVSLSCKYQRELTWGLGYLPVYVSGFGIMSIAVAGILSVGDSGRRLRDKAFMITGVALGVVGAGICGTVYSGNRIVIQRYGYAEQYQRTLMENALHCGLFRSVPPGSFLLCDQPIRSWDSPSFFGMHSGLALDVVRPEGFSPDIHLANSRVRNAFRSHAVSGTTNLYKFDNGRGEESVPLRYTVVWQAVEGPVLIKGIDTSTESTNRPAFFLRYAAHSGGLGYAVLARMVHLAADDFQISGVTADKVLLYVGTPVGYPEKDVTVSGFGIDPATMRNTCAFQWHQRDLKLICSDRRGKVFEVPSIRPDCLFDAKSIVATPTPIEGSLSVFPESGHR